MVDIQCLTAEIRQGNKKRKKEETTGGKYVCPHPAMQGSYKKDKGHVYFMSREPQT